MYNKPSLGKWYIHSWHIVVISCIFTWGILNVSVDQEEVVTGEQQEVVSVEQPEVVPLEQNEVVPARQSP